MLRRALLVSFSILAVCLSALALAQSAGGDFVLTKSTFDSGGGTSSNGDFSVTGTIGQADANPQQSIGGDFLLAGGFWAKTSNQIFMNGFESSQ